MGFFAGNRTVGSLADRFGSLRVLTVALAATVVALVALASLQRWLVPTLAALFLLGFFGSYLVITQQNRVFAAGGDAAPVALGVTRLTAARPAKRRDNPSTRQGAPDRAVVR